MRLFSETQVKAKGGDPEAQVQMGHFYTTGEGVKMNRAEALSWYRKAAEQGHIDAQYIIGIRYQMGMGVDKDYSESVKWYRKAAENGHVDAQANVAECYQYGVGVDKDLVEAYAWWNLASNSRYDPGVAAPNDYFDPSDIANKLSAEARDKLEKEMTPKQIADAQKRTKELRALIDAKLKSRNLIRLQTP